MEFMGMPLGAALFLGGVLLGFGALDITMLISLLKAGDERSRVIVWKTSTFAFNAMVGALVLDVIANYATKQPIVAPNTAIPTAVSKDKWNTCKATKLPATMTITLTNCSMTLAIVGGTMILCP